VNVMSNQKDELAALKKEVEALKSALSGKEDKPQPKKEFVEQPYQHYDPTEGMCMPPSALRAMVNAVPDNVMRGVINDRHAPNTPSTMPRSEQPSGANVRSAGDGTGYVDPRPLGPPPGIALVDAQCIADDVRQRAELKRKLGE
jgi:hypothetical protein